MGADVVPATVFGVLVIGAVHRVGFGELCRSLGQLVEGSVVEARQGVALMAGEVRVIGPMLLVSVARLGNVQSPGR